MWGHMSEYGWGPGMGIGMLLFWGFLIVVIVLPAKKALNSGPESTRKTSALGLLQERYARGEIERDEFEQKKRDLQG